MGGVWPRIWEWHGLGVYRKRLAVADGVLDLVCLRSRSGYAFTALVSSLLSRFRSFVEDISLSFRGVWRVLGSLQWRKKAGVDLTPEFRCAEGR